ncbi:MAG: hypothetical protein A2X23_01625 [Chloroflexi bacterium GWC2_73_18]|nr:MAG: hypothetical protein A2X23_01625 [Chloroflexi bacterium GWC2_73_18]
MTASFVPVRRREDPGAVLRRLFGGGAPEGPADLLGLEQEYRLRAGDEQLDFRRLIHRLPVPGRRLDPGDPNAYRLAWGGVLTADGREAEVATPPVRRRPGFARAIESWAGAGRAELKSLLPDGVRSEGYSTHLSAAMPASLNERVAALHARTFAAAQMLLMDGPASPGLLVRPRPGRTELCGEYVEGARLRAAAALAAGSLRACAAALRGDRAALRALPPPLRASIVPALARFGWYVDRSAFGPDLHATGRATLLDREAGGTISAQAHLELAWAAAREALGASASAADLEAADRLVAGLDPLPIEAPARSTSPAAAVARLVPPAPSVFGQILAMRRRPGFTAVACLATWDFTVFELARDGRRAFASIPRASLGRFLRMLDAGVLDSVIAAYLAAPPAGRALAAHAQTGAAGLYDAIGAPGELAAPERHPAAALGVATDRPGKRREDEHAQEVGAQQVPVQEAREPGSGDESRRDEGPPTPRDAVRTAARPRPSGGGVIGALARIVLVGGIIIAAVLAALAFIPTPSPCTPDPAQPEQTFYLDEWNAFEDARAPDQVGFDQAEVNEALGDALADRDLPVRNARAHFCADGTAQLAFEFPLGPASIQVLAKGRLSAPPVAATLDEVQVGGLPTFLTDPAVEMARDLVDELTSYRLEGPIDRVVVRENAVLLFND